MNKITRKILRDALNRMGEMADLEGIMLEVCLYGGALMMLVYDARAMTKDVDAIIHPSREGRKLSEKVARQVLSG